MDYDSDEDAYSSDEDGGMPDLFMPFGGRALRIRCPECDAPGPDGFQCPADGRHLNCAFCLQPMAARGDNPPRKQSCVCVCVCVFACSLVVSSFW